MKQLPVFLIAMLSCLMADGQCVVANLSENIMYVGLNNTIAVAVSNHPCLSYFVVATNGKVESVESPYNYDIYPDSVGKTEIFVISRNNKKDTLGRAMFRSKSLPEPVARVAGKIYGDLNASVLRAQSGIPARLEGFALDSKFSVLAYTVIIMRGERVFFTRKETGALFTPEVKQAFNSLQPGDTVLFTAMSCRGPDGKIRRLQPLEFIIVE
jgi:hypothetical protein